MKKTVILIALAAALCLSGCGKTDNGGNFSDSYLEGYGKGKMDVFLDLYYASSDKELLSSGDLWETDHFSLLLSDECNDGNYQLHFDLKLNDLTIERCQEERGMLFCVYSYSAGEWREILSGDDYYYLALFDYVKGKNAKWSCGIYEEEKKIAAIIVIDSCIYTAAYLLK